MCSMVKCWNKGIVKIDGVDFMVTKEVIFEVMGIHIIGQKFHRYSWISRQAVIKFTKDVEEKKALVKKSTY